MTPEHFRELAGRLRARGVWANAWSVRQAVDRQVTSPGGLALPRAGQVEMALRGEKGGHA